MSIELANYSKLLGQVASNLGYSDLIAAADEQDGLDAIVLQAFFRRGYTDQIERCIDALDAMAKDDVVAEDVRTTAAGLARMMDGVEFAILTDGMSADDTKAAKLAKAHPKVTEARNRIEEATAKFLKSTRDKIASHIGQQRDVKDQAIRDREKSGLIQKCNELINWKALVPQVSKDLQSVFGGAAVRARSDVLSGISTAKLEKRINVTIDPNDVIQELNETAADWADDRAAEMVGMKWVDGELVENPDAKWAISQTTRDDLQDIITRAFQQETSMKDLAAAIQSAGTFSDSRAANIAKTEVSLAQNQGNLAGWKASGVVDQVELLLSADHPEDSECDCSDIADGGPYPIDQAPMCPVHPSCECDLTPIVDMGGE